MQPDLGLTGRCRLGDLARIQRGSAHRTAVARADDATVRSALAQPSRHNAASGRPRPAAPPIAVQLAVRALTGTRVDQRFMTGRHDRSRSRIDFSRARSLRFARFIAPAIAGATMVPNPDGRPRLRSSTIVAPLGVSENV